MKLRFIGSSSNVGDIALRRFGQAFELAEDVAEDVLAARRCPVLPETVFQKIGFTEEELRIYSNPGTHADAPAAFLEKKKRALQALYDPRAEEGAQPPEEGD